jgi:pimeloyl-ACP methyl ester carboxylesterase
MKRTRLFGRILTAAAGLLAVFVLNACQPDAVGSYQSPLTPSETILSRATKRSLAYEGIRRNPVILIHGLLGARLEDPATGNEFWGTFSPVLPDRDNLKLLSIPMSWGKPLRELSNNTRASFLLDTVSIRVIGLEFSMYAYGPLVDAIKEAGYVQEGSKEHLERGRCPSLFVFYYDWRRSIAENAIELGKFIRAKQALLQPEYRMRYGTSPDPIRFDLMGHSLGGLVARYYMRYGETPLPDEGAPDPAITWAGAKNVGKLIQIGTPNSGYLDTVIELVNGLRLQPGAPLYPAAVIGTFPSYYEMMPFPQFAAVRKTIPGKSEDESVARGEPVDLYDLNTWIRYKWGLANPDCDDDLKWLLPDVKTAAERRYIALEHLQKCLASAKRIASMLSTPDPRDSDVFQMIFIGDSVPTSSLALADEDGSLRVVRYDSGDGKVSAVSARADLRNPDRPGAWGLRMESPVRWNSVIHVSGAHMGITLAPDFLHNMRFYLVQFPDPGDEDK